MFKPFLFLIFVQPSMVCAEAKIWYYMHIHKSGGTYMCHLAKQIYGRYGINGGDNCNVPKSLWYTPTNQDYQFSAYFGRGEKEFLDIHQQILKKGWKFVANEGSLEDVMRPDLYNYAIVMRDPISMIGSFYKMELWYSRKRTWNTFREYMEKGWWGKDNYITRRLCGVSCVREEKMNSTHYTMALRNLKKFHVVITMEELTQGKLEQFCEFDKLWCHVKTNNNYPSKKVDYEGLLPYLKDITVYDRMLYRYASLGTHRS